MLIIGCIGCHRALDGHQGLDGAKNPSPGDVMICGYCGTYNILDDDMRPRGPSDKEREEINTQVREILDKMRRGDQP